MRSLSTDSLGIEDKGNKVYIIFLLYGIGVLLPWNVILSCLDFMSDKVSFLSHLSYLDARVQPLYCVSICSQRTFSCGANLGHNCWSEVFIYPSYCFNVHDQCFSACFNSITSKHWRSSWILVCVCNFVFLRDFHRRLSSFSVFDGRWSAFQIHGRSNAWTRDCRNGIKHLASNYVDCLANRLHRPS